MPGQEFILQEYEILLSKYETRSYALIQIEMKGKPYIFSTGSQAVLDQLSQVGNKLPIKATLTKQKRYYKLE